MGRHPVNSFSLAAVATALRGQEPGEPVGAGSANRGRDVCLRAEGVESVEVTYPDVEFGLAACGRMRVAQRVSSLRKVSANLVSM
ncbi:hypothetical protein GCM10027073_29020 [Streptomyces chlorus]